MDIAFFEGLRLDGGHMMPALKRNEHELVAVPRLRQLIEIVGDPRRAEDRREREQDARLQRVQQIRESVQRPFVGGKKRNVGSYSSYLLNLFHDGSGATPPIALFSESPVIFQPLMDGMPIGVAQIAYGQIIVCHDGETQLAALVEAAKREPALLDQAVAIVLRHGKSVEWAAQTFHDLNLLGVRGNASLSMARDQRDDITALARYVATHAKTLAGQVDMIKRQLPPNDPALLTLSALRSGCATLVIGISGAHRKKSNPIVLDAEKLGHIRALAVEWWDAILTRFRVEFRDREGWIMSAPAVVAAVGAVGHELLEIADSEERRLCRDVLIDDLDIIDWSRSPIWNGIAGELGQHGRLKVNGVREATGAIYRAITDPDDPTYRRIRHRAATL